MNCACRKCHLSPKKGWKTEHAKFAARFCTNWTVVGQAPHITQVGEHQLPLMSPWEHHGEKSSELQLSDSNAPSELDHDISCLVQFGMGCGRDEAGCVVLFDDQRPGSAANKVGAPQHWRVYPSVRGAEPCGTRRRGRRLRPVGSDPFGQAALAQAEAHHLD